MIPDEHHLLRETFFTETAATPITQSARLMQQAREKLPVAMDIPGAKVQGANWGDMKAAYMQFAAGTDFAPLLAGLPNDHCQCPHWGYVLEGRIRVTYQDGTEETVKAGEVYYWPPGHSVRFEEDTAYVEFSPRQEMDEVLQHVGRKLEG